MSFDRTRLPEPAGYFEAEGLALQGRGTWRTARCDFHGGSDSMRINVQSGGWVCMACGAKGGDVLAYEMQRHGIDFVQAARALGAWIDDGGPAPAPRAFSASDAMQVIGIELLVCLVVISDARRGITPNEADWERFLQAAGRVETVAEGFRS